MVSTADDALNEALAAVMDGQATPAEWARVNAAWATDPSLRERWALWHAAADGVRAADLPTLHRHPEALLAALHAQLPAGRVAFRRRREWLAPLAVAAGFIAMALGVGQLWPAPAPAGGVELATAPMATPLAQGLGGLSFAQAASGRTLPDAPPEVLDWSLAPPEPAASPVRP